MRILLALIPALMLAGCGGGDDANVAAPIATASPVAAASPPAGKTWVDVVSATPESGYVQGNPDAPIKLIEYGSRSCPVCGRFAAEGVEPLREKYVKTGKVSYEFRDFLVHGAPDFAAALINRCVATEAFFPILDQMYANQRAFAEKPVSQELQAQLQQMNPAQAAAALADAMGMIEFIKQRGVPEAKARQCLADQKMIETVAKVHADAANVYKVNGTPNFFINGQKVEAITWADLEPQLKAAGAR